MMTIDGKSVNHPADGDQGIETFWNKAHNHKVWLQTYEYRCRPQTESSISYSKSFML